METILAVLDGLAVAVCCGLVGIMAGTAAAAVALWGVK
jgi:hypothetical protein